MLKNYLTVAMRGFARQRGYMLINLAGLAVGIGVCLLILLFVRHEVSYDEFHPSAERLVRVLRTDSAATDVRKSAVVLGELAPRLSDTFAGVEQAVRVHRRASVIRAGSASFDEDDFAWADSNFFEVFGFGLLRGDRAQVLAAPGSAVITRGLASRYFGDADPVGQSLTVNGQYELEVTGIAADPPGNTHMRLGVVASMSTLGTLEDTWAPENQGWTYLLLRKEQRAEALQASIASSLRDLVWWWNLDAIYVAYELQPVADIHLKSAGVLSAGEVGDERYVYLLSIVAGLVLAIATINYMNLATARAARRAREVGLRKAVGAGRRQLVAQFMSEAIAFSMVALAAAVVLVGVALPTFNDIAGKQLTIDVSKDFGLLAMFVCLAVLTGLIAGSYPAFFLSSFNPIRVLKGMRDRTGSPTLRRSLVVAQFAITTVLLIGTAVVFRQMQFIRAQNLGFETEQVLVIDKRGLASDDETFKDALRTVPGVVAVSAASGVPVLQGGWVSESHFDGRKVMTMRILADLDYAATLGLEVIDGRGFDPALASDRAGAVLLNEAMVEARGWSDPVGKTVGSGLDSVGNPVQVPVVGVVRDFHTSSVHSPILPAIIDPNPNWARFYRQFVVRLAPGNLATTMAAVESTWERFAPDYPLKYTFVDDAVDALYRSERRFGAIFGGFTALAVIVACLGLFGLAAYTAEQRTKEIGIRKVLGASIGGIVAMLSAEFLRLVLVALVPAIPLGYVLAKRWLDDFAYRIDLSWPLFVVAAVAAIVLAMATVSYQAVRAGAANPVRSLRCE